jgi:hypothetical protein
MRAKREVCFASKRRCARLICHSDEIRTATAARGEWRAGGRPDCAWARRFVVFESVPRKVLLTRAYGINLPAGSFQDGYITPSRKRATALAISSIAASTLAAAACALSFVPPAHGEVGSVPLPDSPCNLPTAGSLIVWTHAPPALDRSVFINESDVYNCRPALDTWKAGEPSGPGFCSKVAWSTDNPGYIPVVPAPPLKKVVDQVGDCGAQ